MLRTMGQEMKKDMLRKKGKGMEKARSKPEAMCNKREVEKEGANRQQAPQPYDRPKGPHTKLNRRQQPPEDMCEGEKGDICKTRMAMDTARRKPEAMCNKSEEKEGANHQQAPQPYDRPKGPPHKVE